MCAISIEILFEIAEFFKTLDQIKKSMEMRDFLKLPEHEFSNYNNYYTLKLSSPSLPLNQPVTRTMID
jgi:hypothetical protein